MVEQAILTDGFTLGLIDLEKRQQSWCEIAVKQNGQALKYVTQRSEILVKEALKQDGRVLQEIAMCGRAR